MNTAIILAGGTGQRMHQEIPKQFINVNDKPLIIYTLEAFQKHPQIDSILVVCQTESYNKIKVGDKRRRYRAGIDPKRCVCA